MKLELPKIIPVFPLTGVIFFPKTNLPLNIFEPRYLALVNDSTKSNKYMGLIQSKKNSASLYSVGCLGKITENKKTKDGRILLNLIGITRFEIRSEINKGKSYREFEVSYNKFQGDLNSNNEQLTKIKGLSEKTKLFFKKNGLIAPISNEEKQTILESVSTHSKTKVLSEIIEFYLHETTVKNLTIQ